MKLLLVWLWSTLFGSYWLIPATMVTAAVCLYDLYAPVRGQVGKHSEKEVNTTISTRPFRLSARRMDEPVVIFDTVVFVRALINPHSHWGRLVFEYHQAYTG